MSEKTFTRRFVLEGALVTVSALYLPACVRSDTDMALIDSDGQFFDSAQLTVLNDVAEIMIPRTDTPGAADAKVAAVIDGMMLTWAGAETKARFARALIAFETRAQAAHQESYAELARGKRTAIVESFDEQAFSVDARDDAEDYKHLKKLVFHVYYTSEEGSAGRVPVPGEYNGNLTLDEYESLMKLRSRG